MRFQYRVRLNEVDFGATRGGSKTKEAGGFAIVIGSFTSLKEHPSKAEAGRWTTSTDS